MGSFKQIPLKDLIEQIGEEKVNKILSNFSCPLNKDVEYFLHHRAIPFSKSALAPTHLVFCDLEENDPLVLVGYYTFTMKNFSIPRNNFSKTRYKELGRFSVGNASDGSYVVPAPLIAQLGKNYTEGANYLIQGSDLLGMALEQIEQTQMVLGGRICYIECEDKKPLIEFYNRHGFQEFQRRRLDADERKSLNGKELLQMLRYKR